MISLLIEMFAVGVVTIIIGYCIELLCSQLPKPLYLFILGSCIHLICEMTGVNKYYCKNGVACTP